MRRYALIPLPLCLLGVLLCCAAFAQKKDAPAPPQIQASNKQPDDVLEGEKRFRANCGRCHLPPHKLSPGAMKTAIRHMRVRAMLTDEDMRLIMAYMTR